MNQQKHTPQTPSDTVRLFFAIWPSASASNALADIGKRLHDQCGGRVTRVDTIHVTLAFLGTVLAERVDELCDLAKKIRVPAFNINLAKFGWWPHNRVVWAAPKRTSQELLTLANLLRSALTNAGFLFDENPFAPHVTLLRKAACNSNPFPTDSIEWRAEDFVLVRSVLGAAGPSYEVMGRWPLLPQP